MWIITYGLSTIASPVTVRFSPKDPARELLLGLPGTASLQYTMLQSSSATVSHIMLLEDLACKAAEQSDIQLLMLIRIDLMGCLGSAGMMMPNVVLSTVTQGNKRAVSIM